MGEFNTLSINGIGDADILAIFLYQLMTFFHRNPFKTHQFSLSERYAMIGLTNWW